MLDDIERRRFLVEPAREHSRPCLVRALNVDLDKGAGQFFLFPRRARFASAQPHDHVFPADRLAWVQGDVLDDAVSLVEDREHRDALPHRRDARLVDSDRRRGIADHRGRRILFGRLLAARRKRHHCQDRERSFAHVYCGIQGW
jgi:hypothetical protein